MIGLMRGLTMGVVLSAGVLLAGAGTDSGYFFNGPIDVKRVKTLKGGNAVVAYHQSGVVVSENASSPWFGAMFFAQGTMVKDADGGLIQDVALCETLGPDGDLTWSVLWRKADGSATLELKAGTGKWAGITGGGVLFVSSETRVDGSTKPEWEIAWGLDTTKDKPRAGDHAYHDKGLSFHGPNLEDFRRDLSTGVTLIVSSQSGVLLSDDREAKSPRNLATCYDRGTTYHLDGKNLGDVMLLEDTDPDGDIVWLYHEWWYGKGPGSYRFIGGTGKWKGITGFGETRGMLRARTDDHFMLKSEMHWNLD